jgi:hypothetical protein
VVKATLKSKTPGLGALSQIDLLGLFRIDFRMKLCKFYKGFKKKKLTQGICLPYTKPPQVQSPVLGEAGGTLGLCHKVIQAEVQRLKG